MQTGAFGTKPENTMFVYIGRQQIIGLQSIDMIGIILNFLEFSGVGIPYIQAASQRTYPEFILLVFENRCDGIIINSKRRIVFFNISCDPLTAFVYTKKPISKGSKPEIV